MQPIKYSFQATSQKIIIGLPKSFTMQSMRGFIRDVTEAQEKSQTKNIHFDFMNLDEVDPAGVVALSNTIEYFRNQDINIYFQGHQQEKSSLSYLDEIGFFQQYLGHPLSSGKIQRLSMVPLKIFNANEYISYLYGTLTPWIAQSVNLSNDTLETIRACLEEVFQNIKYHSEVNLGCIFAQNSPKNNKIHIAISDFGIGIPKRVRSVEKDCTDSQALRLAVKEGFTTKTNVRNRGVGLSTLLQYITQKNGGTVLIHSGKGYLSATRGEAPPNVTVREMEWSYPGTLVHVILRTDTLEKLEDEVTPEVFQWQPSA